MADDKLVKGVAATEIELTPQTIKTYINQYASAQEVALFLNQCVMFGLNPFKREIYLIKYSTNQPATFLVAYHVYLKRADRTEKWNGMESGTEDDPETGKLVKAWAKVYRKDWTAPLYHEVYLDEYVQKKQDGSPTKFWSEKPRTMLKKVAISQAFRMAFPDEFSGMPYTAEEMPVDHEKLSSKEIVAEAKVVMEPTSQPPAKEEEGFALETDATPLNDSIQAAMLILSTDYDMDAGDIIMRIKGYVKNNFKREVVRIPEDLAEKEAERVLKNLNDLMAEKSKAKSK